MRYHEYPTAGVGTPTFTIYINNSPQYNTPLRGGDGSGGAYQWADMPLQPDNNITAAQCQTIGALCYDAGVSVNMNYKSSGSSASLWDTRDQLVSTFGYSNAIRSSSPTLGSSLSDMLNTNMDASLPVLLGVRGTGGHAIICDGYGYNSSTLYHHMNMGWSGDDNAWYQLPIVDAYFYYDSMDTAVYNIYISGTGEIISGRVTDMSGNPLESVTVTAEISGGSSYSTTTNDNGIYALVNLPSGTSFTVSAEKSPHLFTDQYVSTLTSSTGSSSSGNVWGVDFVSTASSPPTAYDVSIAATSGLCEPLTLNAVDDGQPNPPAVLSYEITSLPEHGTLTDPLAGAIISVPYALVSNGSEVEYCPCSYFAGEDSFDYTADDGGDAPNGGVSEPATVTIDVSNIINVTYEIDTDINAEWPMYTYYHDSRTQVIYLPADIGAAQTITDLALNVYDEPGQTLNNWTIRMKHTTENDYTGAFDFETTGWTVVYQSNDVISSTGWHNFHFDNEFEYDGVRNLLVDFSHNNSFYTLSGICRVSDTAVNRVLLAYSDSDHGDPLAWSAGYSPQAYVATAVPNLKLISRISAEKIAGDINTNCKVDFIDYSIFASAWQTTTSDGAYDEDCDIADPIGIIDEADLAAFALTWLDSTP